MDGRKARSLPVSCGRRRRSRFCRPGIPRSEGWLVADQLVVPFPWFACPAVDAVPRQPDEMDVRRYHEKDNEQPHRPYPPDAGRQRQGDGKEHDELEDALPLRLMRFEMSEHDVADREDAEHHGGIEPKGFHAPHDNVGCRKCLPPPIGGSGGRG
jgi:hypothetical protein